jgi:hypothetical protein
MTMRTTDFPFMRLVLTVTSACALAGYCKTTPAQTDLVTHVASRHLNTDNTYNERNWGLALRQQTSSPDWAIQGGAYKNSYARTALYVAGEHMPLRAGSASAGMFLGAATGYPKGLGALGLFVVRYREGDAGVVLRTLPPIGKRQGVVALEVSWRLR